MMAMYLSHCFWDLVILCERHTQHLKRLRHAIIETGDHLFDLRPNLLKMI